MPASDDLSDRAIDMLAKLVAFDTTSRNSNLELIRYIQDYLNDAGVKSTLVPNAEGTKANLFATIGPDAASCCRGTPTWCRSMASRGRPIRGR